MNCSPHSIRMALAAVLLLVSALSLSLANDPCIEYAGEDECKSPGCKLTIYKSCPDYYGYYCEEYWTSGNVPGPFVCKSIKGPISKCVTPKDKNGEALTRNCMRYTWCIYSDIQQTCIEDLFDIEYCPAPYKETVTTGC